jgi:hypothetical protein
MGNISERTKIESRMLSLKIRRQRIQAERKEIIKEIETMLKSQVIREPIPDYIEDPNSITLTKRKNYYYEKGTEPVKKTKDFFNKYFNIGVKVKKN